MYFSWGSGGLLEDILCSRKMHEDMTWGGKKGFQILYADDQRIEIWFDFFSQTTSLLVENMITTSYGFLFCYSPWISTPGVLIFNLMIFFMRHLFQMFLMSWGFIFNMLEDENWILQSLFCISDLSLSHRNMMSCRRGCNRWWWEELKGVRNCARTREERKGLSKQNIVNSYTLSFATTLADSVPLPPTRNGFLGCCVH